MEAKNNMGNGLHLWAFVSIALLSALYLTIAIFDDELASHIDNIYAGIILAISLVGARERF